MNDDWPSWTAGDAEISVRPPDVCFRGFGLYGASGGENLGFAEFLASAPARAALERFMGRRIGKQVIAAVEKRKPGTWQNGAYAVEVRLAEVCVGTNDPRGGTGTSWPTADFLAGVYDDVVRNTFGEEALREIRKLLKR